MLRPIVLSLTLLLITGMLAPTRAAAGPPPQHAPATDHAGGDDRYLDEARADVEQRVAAGSLTREAADVILQRVQGMIHPGGDAVPITARELAAAADLVARVRSGTTRLADVQVAMAEGYRPIPLGSRGGLVHYHNHAYYAAGRILDAERPEQLVYAQVSDGELELVGVMFLMPPGQPGPRLGGPLTAWHAHTDICSDSSTYLPIGTTDAAGACPPGAVRTTSAEMLHVWLFDNPRGVFDSWMQPEHLPVR
jgi:hypothetical protein